VEKPNSVIVYGYNKYLLEQLTRQNGTDQINFSNQQLYSAVRLDRLQCRDTLQYSLEEGVSYRRT